MHVFRQDVKHLLVRYLNTHVQNFLNPFLGTRLILPDNAAFHLTVGTELVYRVVHVVVDHLAIAPVWFGNTVLQSFYGSLLPALGNLVDEFRVAGLYKKIGLDETSKPVLDIDFRLDQPRLVAAIEHHPVPGNVTFPHIPVKTGVDAGHHRIEFTAPHPCRAFRHRTEIDNIGIYDIKRLLVKVHEIHCVPDDCVIFSNIYNSVEFAELVLKRFKEQPCHIIIGVHRLR